MPRTMTSGAPELTKLPMATTDMVSGLKPPVAAWRTGAVMLPARPS